MDVRWKQRFSNYCKAFGRLSEYVEESDLNELEKLGVIKAFEYTFELAWKTLQDFLEEKAGLPEVKGPRPVIMQAFMDGYIGQGEIWMEMLKDRNRSTHTYDEQTSEEIFKAIITKYVKELLLLREFLDNQV